MLNFGVGWPSPNCAGINAILTTYGTPDRIRVELAREAGMGPSQRVEDDQER